MAHMKTDVPGIYKERDGILINKDNEGLRAYKQKKIQSKKMQIFEEDLEKLKNDISEIKDMLRGLVK